MINKVFLVGNLTRDVEVRQLNNGGSVYNMGMAVNERRKNRDGEWEEFPVFVDLTMFDSQGTRAWMTQYFVKGAKATVEGRLRYDTWTDRETDEKRSKLYVVVDSIEMDWPKRDGGSQQPRQQRQQARQTRQQPRQQQDLYDESIPF